VPFEELARLAADFHYGLMPLDYRYDEPRLMDSVALSNRFVSYLRLGLPVIVSSSDVWTAALIDGFGAGLIIDFCDIPDLSARILQSDYRSISNGARRLLAHMAQSNEQSNRELRSILKLASEC
jgi:hypothetical protein